MNSITTNAYSDLDTHNKDYYDVTLNATLNSKDHALYAIGFVFVAGAGGDPKYGDEGAECPGVLGDWPVGPFSISTDGTHLQYDTLYRVVAAAIDGTTMEIFYGETITINISSDPSGKKVMIKKG